MKVVIMGAGVVGVTTAWYLAQAGCEVTVIDRQASAGLETSFANCGQISPGYAAPWAAPGIPMKALKWMFQQHAPLIIRPDFSLHQIRWIIQLLKNCNLQAYTTNRQKIIRLAEYSRDKFIELRTQTSISYEARQNGTLQLFRNQQQLDNMTKDLSILREFGIPFSVLDRDGCAGIEPALTIAKPHLSGGLHLPNDETGDCYLFTQQLFNLCCNHGVRFELGKTITAIEYNHNKVSAVRCGETRFVADHFVMALGSFSRQLMQALNINLPVYPVKGYSLTIPISNSAAAPISTVLDETYKVAITRFDNRIRVGGMAELSGYKLHLNEHRRKTLAKSVTDLFPGGGDINQATFWTGLRPMTPDGVPIIGPTHIANLSLNTGHGTLGFTMSLGSAKLLADSIIGAIPEIDIKNLTFTRYLKH